MINGKIQIPILFLIIFLMMFFPPAVHAKTIEHDSVDSLRVYITGMSNGAMMAYRLAAEIPERIAAIAPVSGMVKTDPGAVLPPMPVLHFHGTGDAYAPWAGGRGSRSLQRINHAPVEETISR
jgi:polyhydroxybutyrate depolymerase